MNNDSFKTVVGIIVAFLYVFSLKLGFLFLNWENFLQGRYLSTKIEEPFNSIRNASIVFNQRSCRLNFIESHVENLVNFFLLNFWQLRGIFFLQWGIDIIVKVIHNPV